MFFVLGSSLLVAAGLAAVPSATANLLPEECPAVGVELDPETLPEGTDTLDCDLTGEEITVDGLTMQVPDPGVKVTMEVYSVDGADVASVEVDESGEVTYSENNPDQQVTGLLATGGPSACSDGAYTDKDEKQLGIWYWYLGDGARPAGLSTTETANALKEAMGWLSTGYSDCATDKTYTAYDVAATYEGVTTYESDMHVEGAKTVCGDGSLDGRDHRSVVDFGNLDDNGDPPLATECTWMLLRPGANNSILESDIRFNTTDKDFYYAKPAGCDNKYDLRGVAIHEFGHSFGLGHVSETTHGYLTMSTQLGDCDNSQRTLGKGDILSLNNTYG